MTNLLFFAKKLLPLTVLFSSFQVFIADSAGQAASSSASSSVPQGQSLTAQQGQISTSAQGSNSQQPAGESTEAGQAAVAPAASGQQAQSSPQPVLIDSGDWADYVQQDGDVVGAPTPLANGTGTQIIVTRNGQSLVFLVSNAAGGNVQAQAGVGSQNLVAGQGSYYLADGTPVVQNPPPDGSGNAAGSGGFSGGAIAGVSIAALAGTMALGQAGFVGYHVIQDRRAKSAAAAAAAAAAANAPQIAPVVREGVSEDAAQAIANNPSLSDEQKAYYKGLIEAGSAPDATALDKDLASQAAHYGVQPLSAQQHAQVVGLMDSYSAANDGSPVIPQNADIIRRGQRVAVTQLAGQGISIHPDHAALAFELPPLGPVGDAPAQQGLVVGHPVWQGGEEAEGSHEGLGQAQVVADRTPGASHPQIPGAVYGESQISALGMGFQRVHLPGESDFPLGQGASRVFQEGEGIQPPLGEPPVNLLAGRAQGGEGNRLSAVVPDTQPHPTGAFDLQEIPDGGSSRHRSVQDLEATRSENLERQATMAGLSPAGQSPTPAASHRGISRAGTVMLPVHTSRLAHPQVAHPAAPVVGQSQPHSTGSSHVSAAAPDHSSPPEQQSSAHPVPPVSHATQAPDRPSRDDQAGDAGGSAEIRPAILRPEHATTVQHPGTHVDHAERAEHVQRSTSMHD